MYRRHFLSTGAAFLGAALLPATAAGQAAPGGRRIRIAVKYEMITGAATVLERFKIAKEAGYEGIEPNSPIDEKVLAEMAAASRETGILIPGLVCAGGGRNMGSPDEAKRLEGVETMKTSLRQAKALGATTVLMYPGMVNKDLPYMDVYRALVKSTLEVLPVVHETGVKIALENVWNNIFMSPLEAVHFLDEVNDPGVGWFLDLGNIARYGWPDHWVKALGKERIFKLDIKGYSTSRHMKEGPGAGFKVEIGEDEIDWKAVMKAIDETGYDGGWISAEVSGGDVNRLRTVREQIARILAL